MSTPNSIIVLEQAELRATVAEAVAEGVAKVVGTVQTKEREEFGFEWVSNESAMRILGLSRTTLARYRADGTLPYAKLGANVYYRVGDIDAVLEARLVSPASR